MTNQEELNIKCREKQFKILCYVRDVCEANNIPMFLAGTYALAAFRGEDTANEVLVCVDAADAMKLAEALNKDTSVYAVDSMLTNPDFPTFEMRVYDTDTLDYKVPDFRMYRYNCLCVRILFLQHIPGLFIKDRLLRSLYTAYKKNVQFRFGGASKNDGRMLAVIKKKEASKGKEYTSKWFFSEMVKGYSGKGKKCTIIGNSYNVDTIFPLKEITFKGEKFFIPGKYKNYFNTTFVRNWKALEIEDFNESVGRFKDPNHSWEEFKSRIEYMDFDKYNADLKKLNERTLEFAELHGKVKRYHDILARTDMRFKLWQQYMPQKEHILELSRNKDYKELGQILTDYLDQMKIFGDKELGLCFDPEIMEAALDVLRHKGQSEKASYYKELVPEEHRTALRIMDYKGNYIN